MLRLPIFSDPSIGTLVWKVLVKFLILRTVTGVTHENVTVKQLRYQEQDLQKPFKDKKIELHGTAYFKKQWSDLVIASGGTVMTKITKRKECLKYWHRTLLHVDVV